MPAPIAPISQPVLPETFSPSTASSSGSGFQDAFAAAIRAVENSGQQASGSVERFLTGEGEELHTTLLATERAQLTFELFLQARNKAISAYQEIMRMQM
jgi:flagellar hook-basal body complex protein FliE